MHHALNIDAFSERALSKLTIGGCQCNWWPVRACSLGRHSWRYGLPRVLARPDSCIGSVAQQQWRVHACVIIYLAPHGAGII
jgi:hypothetical protein